MKTKERGRNHVFIMLILILISLIWSSNAVFTQEDEGDGMLKSYIWFYSQRNYPYDTVPSGAYGNAIAQRNSLILNNGYHLQSGDNWISMGPEPFYWYNDWNNTYYICSGRINNVKYDHRDPTGNTIYITGADGGVWKTTNSGTNWINKCGVWPNALPTLSSGAFAIDSARGILYYGSGGGSIYFGTGRGLAVFKSTDDGTTWTSISDGLPTTGIYKLAISPQDPDIIFAAEFHGLYKTTNGGGLWEKVVPTGDQELICTDVCFSPNGSKVYAIGPAYNYWPNTPFNGIGYWRSTDFGNNFSPVGQGSGFPHYQDDPFGRSLLAVSHDAEDILYILSYDNTGNSRMYVYKSTNGGSSFVNFTNGNWDMGANAGFNEVIRCSDINPDICFMGFQYLYRTTDGGTNWYCKNGYDCGTHADQHALDFNPADYTKITCGNDGGVWKSDNFGDTWTTMNQNLSLSLIYRIATNTYDPYLQIVCGLEDYGYGYKYQSGGPTYWYTTNMNGWDGTQMLASPFKSNYYTASTLADAKLHYSFNGTAFTETTDFSGWAYAVAPMVIHPSQPGTAYTLRFNTSNALVFKSTNYGVNWNNTPWSQFTKPDDRLYPTLIAISQSNPNIIIADLANANEFWHYNYDLRSRLYKSIDGGLNWNEILQGGSPEIPDRFFTHVEFDPKNGDEVYLTVSGYESHHVFKSSNGGSNWSDINGNLPDNPVNDLIIHYPDANTKELIVATDVGIFRTDAQNINWKVLAGNLPNAPVTDLDYNRLSGKLRAATWGRGAWEVHLDGTEQTPGPIYVKDNLYITAGVTLKQPIIVCSGGKLILGHSDIPDPITIYFENNANIVVMDGGQIDASSGVAITLRSSGSWGGIEIQGTGYGTIKNCTFLNTTTPIAITAGLLEGGQRIYIDNCTFSAPVSINNRHTVTVENSHWNYTSAPGANACVYSLSSNNIDINTNYLNTLPSSVFVDATAINVVYGESITIVKNTINKCSHGIDVHNCSNAYVNENIITSGSSALSTTGIFMDYAYSSTLRLNTINDYPTGIYMINSSPTLYINYIDNFISTNNPEGIKLHDNSFPRLRPLSDELYQFWDAGYNFIFNESPSNNQSISFKIDHSLPDVGFGYNRIKAEQYYIDGCSNCELIEYAWNAEYTCWSELPPNMNKFHFTDGGVPVVDNYTCDPPPGGAGEKGEILENKPAKEAKAAVPDPPSIIVNRGNGVFDTVKVTAGGQPVTNDKTVYFNGVKNELLANYSAAIGLFQLVIQNYQDSGTAILSLKRILSCRDKMTYDSSAYSSLRAYYQQLAANNLSDTSFANVAGELAVKCLVRLKHHQQAIGEYENIIANSTDSMKILGCELNIIEIYMIMNSGGDIPSFTGTIASLKPQSIEDGFRLINEKLHRMQSNKFKPPIPEVFSLSQNYPNPFNPLTKINYAIPKRINVTLKIYDILGRLVKTLVNEFKEPGFYTVQFDGSAYASGVYFYKIEAGDFVQSKKMVLVK